MADQHARQRAALRRHRKAAEALAATRDATIRNAHKAGLSYRAISDEVGLSHQRVAQICSQERRP